MTITLTREEAQQVLDALELECTDADGKPVDLIAPAIETLRARLSAPEPEPVAWRKKWEGETKWEYYEFDRYQGSEPLYTAPPQREWQNAAIRLGEELSSVGPDGYYNMTAQQWLDWALDQQPRGKNSLPAPREWQSLTDEDRQELAAEQHGWEGLCSAVEAKLREKNA